jgi:hypothetical protein
MTESLNGASGAMAMVAACASSLSNHGSLTRLHTAIAVPAIFRVNALLFMVE